jgi:hypothetical protein
VTTPGRGRRAATAVFVLITAMFGVGFTLVLVSGEPLSLNELLLPVGYSFAVVGYLIAVRRPRNAIARTCLVIGSVWALEALLVGAVIYEANRPGWVPWPEALAAIGVPLWIPGVSITATFVLMLFPDGRLPSRRWRWLPWTTGFLVVLSYFVTVLSEPESFGWGRPGLENPFAGVLGPWLDEGGVLVGVVEFLAFPAILLACAASITALVMRYRKATGVERQQVKWLATAGSASVVIVVSGIFLVDIFGEVVGLLANLSFSLIPISIGIAVLRYRLYEIDRLVSRTVTYALLVGLLAATYGAIALALPRALGITGDSPFLVATATLAAAMLFYPARRRTQSWVDRRFNRARYDALREIERFAHLLRTSVGLDDLSAEVLDVVATTMQPTSASVWFKDADPAPLPGLRPVLPPAGGETDLSPRRAETASP